LMVTFEAMMTSFDSSTPDRSPPRVLSWANNRKKRESQNPRLASGVSHRIKHLFSRLLNSLRVLQHRRRHGQTPCGGTDSPTQYRR
jgi:hypothetical protein